MAGVAETHFGQYLAELRRRIGEPAEALSHTTELIAREVLACWPEAEFARIAADQTKPEMADAALNAINVTRARSRELLEAKFVTNQSCQNALDLLLSAVVVETANMWFGDPETRIAIREIIAWLRSPQKRQR